MGKEKNATVPFVRELFQFGVYKRSQGRIARQVTFAILAIVIFIAAWRAFSFMGRGSSTAAVPWLLMLVGWWIAYRLVNMPSFADFLIAVEAEMNKVSWPTRKELIRSSVVVIFTIFFLALVLFGFDVFWQFLFNLMGIAHR